MKNVSVSTEKKVQVFKWLLKKHGCTIELKRDFIYTYKKNREKTLIFSPVVIKDGKLFKLMVAGKDQCSVAVSIPYKYNISYANVLDYVLALMKKDNGRCYIVANSWPYKKTILLDESTTIEMLVVQFDLLHDAFSV